MITIQHITFTCDRNGVAVCRLGMSDDTRMDLYTIAELVEAMHCVHAHTLRQLIGNPLLCNEDMVDDSLPTIEELNK